MRRGDRIPRLWQIVAGGCLGLMVIVAALLPAAVEAMPPRPPRATPAPIRVSWRTQIVLLVALPPEVIYTDWQAIWTVVQWQDAQGGWHDVDGWRGALDELGWCGKKTWDVDERHLGQEPFRWLVYDREGGALLATSLPFSLPITAGDIMEVGVRLDQAPDTRIR
jgi:hypothetical protein